MMTEAELAGAIFGETSETRTNASIATGTALEASSGGRVRVKVDGTQLGGESGVMLDTTRSISAGQRVIITLYGEAHRGRRAFVSGVVGESEGGGGGDISELEARVTTLESSVSSLSSSVSSLSSTVAGHTTQISSLSGQVSTISGQVSSLQSDVSSLQYAVSSLSSTVSGHTSTLSSYGTRISNLESTTSSLSTQLSTLSGSVSDLSDDLSALSSQVSGLSSDLSTLSSTVSGLSTRLTTAEGSISTLQSDVSGLTTRVGDAEDDIDALDTRVTALEQGGGGGGDISALAARVTQCEEDIDDLQSDVSGLGTRMTSAEGSITSLQGTVSGHTSSISTLQSDVSGLTTRVGDAEGDIDDLETDMTSAQGDITSLDTRVTALEQGGGGGIPPLKQLSRQEMIDILQPNSAWNFTVDNSNHEGYVINITGTLKYVQICLSIINTTSWSSTNSRYLRKPESAMNPVVKWLRVYPHLTVSGGSQVLNVFDEWLGSLSRWDGRYQINRVTTSGSIAANSHCQLWLSGLIMMSTDTELGTPIT